MNRLRRRLLQLVPLPLAVGWIPRARADEDAWRAVAAGRCAILLRHARTTPGIGDPPGFRLEDCSTQRNLSDAGRAQARRFGLEFERRGIRVDEVNYHSSQPWPFPSSLMLGFAASAANDDIRLPDGELEDARWFSRDDIRQGLDSDTLRLPMRVAVSHRLIREWYHIGGVGRLD